MTDKEKIRNIIELFIAWNGETEAIDTANIDSAIEFIVSSLQPVSEDLENTALEYATHYDKNWSEVKDGYIAENEVEAFKAGAKWKEQKMMAKAVDGVVHHFEKCKVASVHYNDPTGVPMAYFTFQEGLSAGDKVKIIVIKED